MSPRRRVCIDRGLLALTAIFLVAFPFLFKPWVHGFDPVGYYSWLRSVMIDGDLNVGDEFAHYGYAAERGSTPTGHTYNEFAVGSAVLWSPFFLLAHGASLIAHATGQPVAVDGYAPAYVWAICLGSAIYAFAGILLAYCLCRELYAPFASLLAVMAVWLSGSLVFYMYSHPAMSHANDAFAYALFVFTWHKTRHSHTSRGAALRGAAAGLCALVRQMNAVLVAFVLAEIALEGIRTRRSTGRATRVWRAAGRVMVFCAAWCVVYAPQIVAWRIVLGRWVELNPYSAGVGVGFDWLHPRILGVLFSTDRGLFTWMPLMLVAVLGWCALWRRDRRLAALLAVSFALQLYVVASWGAWSGDAAFGQRFFTNMMPAFVLGLAALLGRLEGRIRRGWLIAACGVFAVWNGLLLVRYVLEDVPRAGPVPVGQLVIGQFSVIPRYLGRILQILVARH